MFDDLTVVICSYKQQEILGNCLKSLAFHHPEQLKILIVENSNDEKICNFLTESNVNFWKNDAVSTAHSPSLSHALKHKISTKNVLILDSDVLLLKPLDNLYRIFLDKNLDLMGEEQGDRGGYLLYPRLYPAYLFANIENINRQGIEFHNQEKIDRTGSHGFFNHVPIQQNRGNRYYDVGSSFYEECKEKGLRIARLKGMTDYFFTTESLSWAEASGIPAYEELGRQRKLKFLEMAKRFENVDIKGKFKC